jgi:hypothetical protein
MILFVLVFAGKTFGMIIQNLSLHLVDIDYHYIFFENIDNVKHIIRYQMNLRKIASIYAIIIGIAMICMWIIFLITNQAPEKNTAPLKIGYHLLAEFLTAILLLIGGFGLFTKKAWSFQVYLISMGMLLYTVIVSAGYYANLGAILMVGMFTVFQILTAFFIVLTFLRYKKF